MQKIEFVVINDQGSKDMKLLDDKYILLYYFLTTFRSKFDLPQLIVDFKSIEKGERTFEEIQESDSYLNFGSDSGYIVLDKETAHFISNHPEIEPSFDMPLKELITLMNEWREFLESGAVA